MTDDEYLALESKTEKALKRFIKNHAQGLSILWKYGDGDGGSLHDCIRARLIESGHVRPIVLRPTPKKAKIGNKLRMQVFEKNDFTCQKCGARKNLSIDHIYPESLGGKTEIENLQTLCFSCNAAKGARP